MDRRAFLRHGLVATAAFSSLGRSFWQQALGSHAMAQPGTGPYGPLLAPDARGFRLPAGFTSREIARAGEVVAGTTYLWPAFPDGGATFAVPGGGWIYTCNSEIPVGGGASAVRFAADGTIADAYRILGGTSTNCAGGSTPWGTWLSCEETDAGHVWECDPTGAALPVIRPALGTFKHEAAVVDPLLGHVYLTEDQSDSRFYRFTPATPGDLSAGLLEVARVESPRPERGGAVTWLPVPNPNIVGGALTTRQQVPGSTLFRRGEGAWFDSRHVYFTTTTDHRIWAYDCDAGTIEVLFDSGLVAGSPLEGPDNLTVAASGDLFVAEDGGNLEIVLLAREGVIAPFLRLTDTGSELTGVAFDPGGSRLYLSSQRSNRIGITYEVSGPFRA